MIKILNMRRIVMFWVMMLVSMATYAQTNFLIGNANQYATTCNGVFYDDGGANEDYSGDVEQFIQFCPDESFSVVKIEFEEFELAPGDYLEIHEGSYAPDGSNLVATYPNDLIGTNTIPPDYVAENECIEIRFVSVSTDETAPGWKASISCEYKSLTGCPVVDSEAEGNITINGAGEISVCEIGGEITLTADYLKTGATTSYEVLEIPYEPPFEFNSGSATSVDSDDAWSEIINLGFNFCFFDESYSRALVTDNGAITFNISGFGGEYSPFGWAGWSFNQPIPSAPAGSGPPYRTAIFGVLQDTNASSTASPPDAQISYEVVGEYPCRMLVFNIYEIGQFSCNQSVGTQTSQVVIYEGTNIIDVYVEKRTPCLSWNSGSGLIGIQNQDATEAYTPPGRNTGTWEAHNEAWRFRPNGEPNYTLTWLIDGEVYAVNEDEITLTPEVDTEVTVRVEYEQCGGEPIVSESIHMIRVGQPPVIGLPRNLRSCRIEATDGASFDLTEVQPDLILDDSYNFEYYITEADALNRQNALTPAQTEDYFIGYNGGATQMIWVNVVHPSSECFWTRNFTIKVKNCEFQINPLPDMVLCEGSGDTFDLTIYDTVVYNANLGYTVSYHNTEEDAEFGVNPIEEPEVSSYVPTENGEEIWVRVEDDADPINNFEMTSFVLYYHPNPVINPLQQSIYGCEVPGTGGSGEFDLSLNIGNITMNTPYLNVEYYLTEAQAELGDSSLSLPTLYVGPSGTIYGRIINTQTGCYTVAPQELIVRATPTANELAPIVHCDANNDGFGTFNLAALVHEIAGNPVPTGIDVTFHHTLSDAQNFANEIENPSNYTNAQSGGETLYVRVGYEYSSCSAIVPLELIVQSTPAVQTPSALEMCDVDNNGLEIFDLTSKESEILNGLTPSDYTITYHTTQANAHSGSSAIGNPSSFSNTVSIVYVRVEDNSSGCYRVVSMLLRLLPTPEVDQPIADYVLCDDEVNDGFTSFDLTSRIPMITDGVQGLIVTFHYTQSDAASGSNPLPNNYQNVVANVQTIHVRVARADTGCYTLTTMNLVVNAGPVINVPEEPYVECSSNQGGGSLSIDLTYYGAMLTVGTDYSIMGYYETESNAINQTSPILAPTAYDGLANNQITVWLRIADEATGCWSVVSIDIILEVRPFIPSNIPSLTLCDETGNRQDGSTIFDLTLQTPYLLDAQPQAGDYVVSYYTSEVAANAGAPAIGNPEQYTNTVNGQVVWFRIERTDSVGGCYAVGSFTLEVDTPMELNIAPNLSLCDASLPNDGTAVFDLTVNEGIILGGEVFGAEVKYHNSQAQAQVAGVSIANPENYNTNGVSSQVIWVSVTNEEGCISVTSFTIRVLPLPEPNLSPLPLEACEDVEFGGEGYFMLGDKDTEIANNDTSLLIQYYYSEADALAGVEGTEIPKDEPFYTGTTIVYVRVSTQPHVESETCFVVVELQLIVHEKPNIPAISPYLICMQHATGFHQFDLLEKNAEVLGNRPSADYTVKYYGSLADAEADFNPLAYQYTNTVAWLQTIWVRLEDNATGCYNVSSLDLRIEERVFAHMPESLEYCDIDGVNDGLTTIDLTLLDEEIKLIQLVPNAQLGVNYYASESDYANGIAIADPSNYTTVSYPQTIIAEVYQLIDWGEGAEPGMCRDTVTFEIEVIDAPEMNDIEDGIICFDYRSGEATPYFMDTGLSESDHTFVWRRNGQVINGATSSYYEATQGGTYVVVVTSNATGCSASQTIVLEEAPAITIDIVHITDGFSDTNGIEVIVSPNTHTYEYALDEGAYQLSNIFLDVSPGEHTVWVRVVGSDTGAACPASKTVVILNYPKFFTPNGDGYNDTWNIWSLQSQPESKIYIFDRHGKLLKQISPNGEGWDGTFNGRDLPSTDYWFRVEYIEPNTGLNKEFRGHFTLKR